MAHPRFPLFELAYDDTHRAHMIADQNMDPRPRVRRLAPPRRAGQRHRLPLHRLGLPPLRAADEPHAVGYLRVRGDLRHGVDEAVADGHPAEVDPPPHRQPRVRGEDERARRRDRLAAVALAGEEERPRAELRRLGGEEGLERGEDVLRDGGLVRRDGGDGRRRAVAGAERAVEEEETEAAGLGDSGTVEGEVVVLEERR
nr:unnamed protein product [Digitaria exilis]